MHGAAKWPHSFMARSPTLGATCFGHLDLGRRFLDPSPSSWGITWGIILPQGTTDPVCRWCFGAENWVQGWRRVVGFKLEANLDGGVLREHHEGAGR